MQITIFVVHYILIEFQQNNKHFNKFQEVQRFQNVYEVTRDSSLIGVCTLKILDCCDSL